MARCPGCGGETFRVEESAGGEVLACAACGRKAGPALAIRLAELEREVALLREDLKRLRQAVNFLNQRVR